MNIATNECSEKEVTTNQGQLRRNKHCQHKEQRSARRKIKRNTKRGIGMMSNTVLQVVLLKGTVQH